MDRINYYKDNNNINYEVSKVSLQYLISARLNNTLTCIKRKTINFINIIKETDECNHLTNYYV